MIRSTLAVWIILFFNTNSWVDCQYMPGRHRVRAPFVQRGDQTVPTDLETDINNGDQLDFLPDLDVVKHHQSYRFRYHKGYEMRKLHPCEQSSCYPQTGNLLIGRESQLFASSTCGHNGQQRYCIVSHLEQKGNKCFWCDSSQTNPLLNHNISNIVYKMYPGTRQKSWWQSENGKENVYIQLDLEAEFHFTHLIITFKTFRPAAMLIERSYDLKQTWQVYRYFAHNCTESFPGIREGYPQNLTDIVCESRYSGVDPSTNGEVIYRVLLPNLAIQNPFSEPVQNLIKMTNLRINFTKLHTLGDDLLDRREEIQEKYYYAITEMVVRGSCSCYGHANRCLPLAGIESKPDMVHGRCECTHNTKGRNCEKCEDFFNDYPWRPAIGKQTNACKKCNCNNHTNMCHFDAALYESTNQVTGGVCDGCQHNTMGANCEQCKPFYYKDPLRDIQDPEVCQPCDCDPRGTHDDGICDSIDNEVNGLIAGSCHCKANVEGRRCDTCKNGFWNFTEDNPEGCSACTCDTFGTIGNQGCNHYTGECTCKRYVTGRDCNQCLLQFWGLSGEKDGCQPCDCDPGGSFDNYCDVITGQCRCRDHMTERRCDVPKQQYFTAGLDFLLYEAEAAKSNGQVVIREQNRDGRIDTWTGTGFVKSYENNYIEFLVNELKTGMEYDISIRYEPQSPDSWEDVRVIINRTETIDPEGPCAESNPEDDVKHVTLPANSRSITVYPSTCLEAGRKYIIRLEFVRSSYSHESPGASILIDSISLIPKYDRIPFFHGSKQAEARRKEFEHANCSFYHGAAAEHVPPACKQYYASIGAYVFHGAFSCQCDPTGSSSKLCEPYGGYCKCKPNVVGRRCDRCAPGTYDFGPEGCKACDCNSIGALDNICNSTTGQCKCRANTYGRECDQCQTGFWNFPNCERCVCNGHTDICESQTGVCTNCRDNTQGDHCSECLTGYYGDPQISVDIPCRPCPCPGVPGSNHSYADSCSLDPTTKDVICNCREGYEGARCDVCANNYYGNPEILGGSCNLCDCNEKIDTLSLGNCDSHTGKCLKCLYDTTGDHCEMCKSGFFRYEKELDCEECVCNVLGTNPNSTVACDPDSGQCDCLPNVTGVKCDECIENYWKIASGLGCEPCNCDKQGSLHPKCNEYDGQCDCKPGFGGRECNECMERFFGDPTVECKECQCNELGSESLECDKKTGACKCRPGIGGYNCNRCARGYMGTAPDCAPCGECFENWDLNLQELKNNTLKLIDRAGDIKKIGATGAYTKEFDEMRTELDEIEKLLNNTDDVNADIIKKELQDLRAQINKTDNETLKDLEDHLDEINEKNFYTESKLDELKEIYDDLIKKAKELENNGTLLQETNVQGALNLIQNARVKADQAAQEAEHSREDIVYAETQCKATETYINNTETSYQNQLANNKNELQKIRNKIDELNLQIPELNSMVCDAYGDEECDPICGGAGCSSCGNSISCENGAKQQAETARSLLNTTLSVLKNKESLANEFIRNISQINIEATGQLAQDTMTKVNDTLSKVNSTLNDANQLLVETTEFLGQNYTRPEDLKKLGDEILNKNIQLTPEEVHELDSKIKEAVKRLTNTDVIIQSTKEDLLRVNKLKQDAEDAKEDATKLLNEAEGINKSLTDAQAEQKEAEKAIEFVSNERKEVESILATIENKTNGAKSTTQGIHDLIEKLDKQLRDLQANITNNGIYAKRVVNESESIMKNAQKTSNDFESLKEKHDKAKTDLNEKLKRVTIFKEKSDELINRARNISVKVTKTQEDIDKLEKSSQENELRALENQLQELVKTMNNNTSYLEWRVKYYKTCN